MKGNLRSYKGIRGNRERLPSADWTEELVGTLPRG